MKHLLQTPRFYAAGGPDPLWLALHGAFDRAEQTIEISGREAREGDTFLVAPQATRICGEGYCWSFARDARAIQQLIQSICASYPIDRTRLSLIGYSMGCTMGLWLIAQNPGLFRFFAALGMGSAFEAWEHDDGGINKNGLSAGVGITRSFLAVDQSDPAGTNAYFEDNLLRLRRLGFKVETFRRNEATHAVSAAMKAAMLQAMPK